MMIGWTFPTSNNEFWQIQKGYFETTCNQFGLEFYSDDCNNDTAEQLADVEAMISKGNRLRPLQGRWHPRYRY